MTENSKHKYIIALDGPTASGTSTTGREMTKYLNQNLPIKWGFISAGNLYRALTWYALNNNISPEEMNQMAIDNKIIMDFGTGDEKIVINDVNIPLGEINDPIINQYVADYSPWKPVRVFLESNLFNKVANSEQCFIVEGRNMRKVFQGHSLLSMYLYASPETRGQRRWNEFQSNNKSNSLQDVINIIKEKDEKDYTREIDPMTRPENASEIYDITFNNDNYNFEQTKDKLLLEILKAILSKTL